MTTISYHHRPSQCAGPLKGAPHLGLLAWPKLMPKMRDFGLFWDIGPQIHFGLDFGLSAPEAGHGR